MRPIISFLLLSFALSCFGQEVKLGLPIGHNASVSSAQYSANGKSVLSCGWDNQVLLWDTETGKIKKRFSIEDMADGAYFCDNESKILLNFFDKSYVIDLKTEEKIESFNGPALPYQDGSKLLIFSENNDGKIWMYDFAQHKLTGKIKAPAMRQEAHLCETSGLLIYNTYDKKYVIDINKKKVVRTFDEVFDIYSSLKVSDNGIWVTFEHDGIVEVYRSDDESYHYQVATNSYGPTVSFDEGNIMLLFKRTGEILRHDLAKKEGIQIGNLATTSAGIVTDAAVIPGTSIFTLATPTHFCSIDASQNWVEINWISYPEFFKLTGVKYVATTPTSKSCLVYGQDYDDIVVFDPIDNHIEKTLTNYSRMTVFSSFVDDDQKILLGSLGSTVCFDMADGRAEWIVHPPDGGETVFDLQIEKDTTSIIPSERMYGSSASSNDGRRIAALNHDKQIEIRFANSNEVDRIIYAHDDPYQKLQFSKNDSILFSWDDSVLIAWDVFTGEQISSMKQFGEISGIDPCEHPDFVIVLAGDLFEWTGFIWYVPTGELADYYQMQGGVTSFGIVQGMNYVYSGNGDDSLNVHTILHKPVQRLKIEDGFSSPMGEEVNTGSIFLAKEEKDYLMHELYLLNPETGVKNKLIRLEDPINDLKQSPDGAFLAVSHYNNQLTLLGLTDGTASVRWKKPAHLSGIIDVTFSSDSKRLVTTSYDGSIIIFDTESGEQILQRYQFDVNNKKWVHIHPSGFFDASSEAMEMMYWTKDLEIIEFAQLKDRYWIPGLWEKVMKGEELPEVGNINDLKLQPSIDFGSVQNDELPILLTKRDGGYGKVSVFINGKEVINDARGNDLDTSKAIQTIHFSIKDHPFLVDGENEIMVKASSADGFVQGRGELFKIVAQKKEAEKPSFYGVVIGVGDYVNDNIDLKFPVKDAKAMYEAVQLGAKNLFGADKTFMYSISSDGEKRPTKGNISSIFEEIASKAQAQDVIMIYLSGHGVTWGGDQGDFYFLTADAMAANKDAYNDPVIRGNNTISTAEWVEMLTKIPALKQIMIIDACGSGKAVDNLIAARDIESSQIKAIDRMKDRTGMYVISGCTADAVSYEASQYGQGLLTYSILEAMKGAAIRTDGSVDLSLIMQHARERVPQLASGLGGIQEPQILSPKGGSIDIGILSEADRAAIPLASPKKVFVRSMLVDADEFEDVLNLSNLLDAELIATSAKGDDASIIFFDTKNYSDACKISGGYTSSAKGIELNLKLRCNEDLQEFKVLGKTTDEIIKQIITIVAK